MKVIIILFILLLVSNCSFFTERASQNSNKNTTQEVKKPSFNELLQLSKQDSATAQYELGSLYIKGQDYKEALKWTLKSAEQGYAPAQFNIGVMYDTGKGLPQNRKKAFEWYLKAAEQGYGFAQINVGVRYYSGHYMQKNWAEAYKWFLLASSEDENDTDILKVITKKIPPEQIAIGKKLAEEWKEKHQNLKSKNLITH